MSQSIYAGKAAMVTMLALGTVGLTTGCATRGYVRNRVDDSSQGLTAKIDTNSQGIKTTQGQVEELNGVTREHGQKIDSLDSGLKETDGKAQQAMAAGQNAQSAANKVEGDVTTLGGQFQNRNHFVVLNEEQVQFKFSSAKLEPSFKMVLDDVAKQLKDNPDAILVMEGHTDAIGPEDYNIQLGQKRVEAVRRYLVVDQEVPINRISDISFGKDRPIDTEKSKDARAKNRAVIVRVMGPNLTGSEEKTVSQTRPAAE